jgi:CBS domain-containing protein
MRFRQVPLRIRIVKVSDLMTQNVFCVSTDQSLNDAAHLMWQHNCGSVPVVNAENRVVGMVTDRDIAMAAYINGKVLVDMPVSTAQSAHLVACKPDDDLRTVEGLMQAHQVHRVPVVGDNCEPVGIVSLNDIAVAYRSGARAIRPKDLCNTLSAICSTVSNAMPIRVVA